MASIPNQIRKFADLEKDAFSTIAQATWQKAAGIMEYVNRSFPVGMLLYFYASQDILPEQPDPKYWKFMDGTMVVNANSIYDGMIMPDLRGKFFKHPGTGQTFPVIDGADSVDITHNHFGITGAASDFGATDLDNGEEVYGAMGGHTHAIGNGDSGVVPIIPAYREVQVYMRIV